MPTSHRPATSRQFGTLCPARYVVSRPTRKNTIFASRPRRNIFPGAKPKNAGASTALPPLWPSFRPQQRKKELVAGQTARFAAPFPSTQFKRGPRAQKPRSRNFIQKFPAFPYSAAGGKLMVTTRGEVERSSSLPS